MGLFEGFPQTIITNVLRTPTCDKINVFLAILLHTCCIAKKIIIKLYRFHRICQLNSHYLSISFMRIVLTENILFLFHKN